LAAPYGQVAGVAASPIADRPGLRRQNRPRRAEKGAMPQFEPNAKEYVERGRFEQPDRSESPAWSHPVIANGKLYLRDQDALFSYDVKAK
jgi:hypothetical protein